jgi:hypothetical protein
MPIPSAFLSILNFTRSNFSDTLIAAYAFVRRLATVREAQSGSEQPYTNP